MYTCGSSAPHAVTLTGFILAVVTIVPNVALSLFLGLGLHWKTLAAIARCFAQLFLLGLLFAYVFTNPEWYYVTAWGAVMILTATREVKTRVTRTYPWFTLHILGAVVLSCLPLAFVAAALSHLSYRSPRVFLPFFGMLLSNTINALTLGAERFLAMVAEDKTSIEIDLAMGADLWMALRPLLRRACAIALFPMINSLSVCGLVSIPGMMTGQLLSGADPQVAASYQAMIMVLIAASQAISLGVVFVLMLWSLKGPFGLVSWGRIQTAPKDPAAIAAERVAALAGGVGASCIALAHAAWRGGRRIPWPFKRLLAPSGEGYSALPRA